MRKILIASSVLTLSLSPIQVHAAVKAGASCSKAGATSTVGDLKFTCTKSGKKLIWSKGLKTSVAPTPTQATTSPTPVVSEAPAPTPTPIKHPSNVWEKYGLTKPTSVDSVIKAATANLKSYTANVRSSQEVKVLAQEGVDPQLTAWVQGGANYVAQRFAYPKLSKQFVDVLAVDSTWLKEAYTKEGFSDQQVDDRLGGFNAGAPAFGGTTTNTWNFTAIQRDNLMVRDKAGMSQTPGHEFFHAIQENLAGPVIDGNGSKVPNWYWEGPAMFVGQQTAGVLNFADYVTVGRPSMTTRYETSRSVNRTMTLSEFKPNDGVIDPYAIGFAATEFLVSQVGMEKMLNVYTSLGKGESFADAFKNGTRIELTDFYSMFEEIRGTLGFAKES